VSADLKTFNHHDITWSYQEESDCGSHGCTGHTYITLKCSCGFEQYLGSYYDSNQRQAAANSHKQAVIEAQLGLVFTVASN
jgi:hypothetical protein